jgi:hypothetical protein
MFPTQVMRLSRADKRGIGNRVLNITSLALVAVTVIVVIVFFWKNPFRVGEITITTPEGHSVAFKVADSNPISELIQKGLENKKTADSVANSLLSVIESLPSGSKLGEKLVELAEQHRSPFLFDSVPVTLIYDSKVLQGWAGVCEKSNFVAKNIAVFVDDEKNGLLRINAYAEPSITFPCPSGGEIVRLNSHEVVGSNNDKVMAKRTL